MSAVCRIVAATGEQYTGAQNNVRFKVGEAVSLKDGSSLMKS